MKNLKNIIETGKIKTSEFIGHSIQGVNPTAKISCIKNGKVYIKKHDLIKGFEKSPSIIRNLEDIKVTKIDNDDLYYSSLSV